MKGRPVWFITCPECGRKESTYPARRERRKPVAEWTMVIPFHPRQFTMQQIIDKKWWCTVCEDKKPKTAKKCEHPTAVALLDCGSFSVYQCTSTCGEEYIRIGKATYTAAEIAALNEKVQS